MATDDEVRSWVFRRIQDYGLMAGFIVSVLTILAFLLPIYRKQVVMEESMAHMLSWQSEYAPKINSSLTDTAVMSAKIDALGHQMQDIALRLDSRHSFRYSPKTRERAS